MKEMNDRHFYLVLLLIYSFSWGGMLLNIGGIYWDDWGLVGHPIEEALSQFVQNGNWFAGVLHDFFLRLEPTVLIYRFVTFSSYLIVGYCFYFILLRLDFIDMKNARLLTLIAVVFPVNHARIAMITMPYAVCLALFFMAWALLLRSSSLNNRLMRVLSCALFFLSFFTQSLLVFFLLPLAQIFWIQHTRSSQKGVHLNLRAYLKNVCAWGLSNLDLFCLPVFFYVFNKIFFAPSALYTKYNVMTLKGLVLALPKSFVTIYTSLIEPLIESAVVFPFYGYIVLIALLTYVLFFKSSKTKEFGNGFCPGNNLIIPMGLITFILGVFAYNAVNKMPMSQDWQSRHQLLVPFGASLLIYGSVEVFSRFYSTYKLFLYISFISILSYSNAYVLNDYYWDWIKQESIIENIKNDSNIMKLSGNAFLFRDNFPEFNAKNRWYRFYELSGFLKKASGDETRFGALEKFEYQIKEWKKFKSHYNVDGYQGGDVAGLVTMEKGALSSKSILSMANLFVDRISNHELYLMRVKEYSHVSFVLYD